MSSRENIDAKYGFAIRCARRVPVVDDAYAPRWQPNTAYLAGAVVLAPSGDVVSAKVDFTSGASYNAANWNLVTAPAAQAVPTSGTTGHVLTKTASGFAFAAAPSGGGSSAVDNGDGTFTLSGSSVSDNGDGTFTVN